MLKNKSKFILILISAIITFSSVCFATDTATPISEPANAIDESAAVTDTQNTNEISGDTADATDFNDTPEVIDDDLYLFDNDIVMDKYVDGNVFLFGNNITVSGRVNGSLYAFGDKITFTNKAFVMDSIYAFANELNFESITTNDLYAFGSTINMAYDTFIVRDMRISAKNLDFSAGVGRNAFVYANEFNFSKDPEKSGLIYGNLSYFSSRDLELSTEFVQGDINFRRISTSPAPDTREIILDKVYSLVSTLLYTVVVFLLVTWLAPQFINKSSSFIALGTGAKSIGLGIIATIVTIIAGFILLFTNITIPLSFALITLFILIMSISFAIVSICITYKVKELLKLEKMSLTILALLVVGIILWVLKQIPYIGWIITLLIWVAGFGIILSYLFDKNKKTNVTEETVKE